MRDYGKLENIQAKLNWLRQESKDPDFTQYLDQMQVVLNKQCASANYLEQEIDNRYKQYQQIMADRMQMIPVQPQSVQDFTEVVQQPRPVAEQVQQIQPATETAQSQFTQQPLPQWAYQQPRKKSSVEFKIGADIFCVIGILFILVAFVMLGVTYMGDLFKGLCVCAIAGALILISELVLRRRMEKLSQCVTGLGICGLYVATLIISSDMLIITAVLFVVNIVAILIPIKRRALGVHTIHMVANTIFTVLVTDRAMHLAADPRQCCLYVLSNILVIGLIFRVMLRGAQKKRIAGIPCKDQGYIALYCVMLFVQTGTFANLVMQLSRGSMVGDLGLSANLWNYIFAASYLIPALISFLALMKRPEKWIAYYGVLLMALLTYGLSDHQTERVFCLLGIFAVCKLLSGVSVLKVSEVVVTGLVAFCSLFYVGGDDWYGIAFVGAFALSILTLHYYKVFHQLAITFVLVLFVTVKLINVSLLPSVILGVLFVLLLIFNHVGIWRDKQQKVYNGINLSIMALWCLLAIFVRDYLNSGIMALLGTAVIVLVLRKKYDMEVKNKYLFLMIFLTYMAFISGMEMAVIISSIIMAIAIVSVILGFAMQQKSVRIYGLILSIAVSLKIMFFDFRAMPIMERMLLFFVVGVIILAISCIYIVLEKKMSNRGETL